MIPAPIPDDDDARLRALHELLILDTPPEERFDRLTAFAAQEFEMPTVLISLVDRDRQWFKSRVGATRCELPRSTSFCGHAILEDDVLLVPDAQEDERFHDNPLVTEDPRLRFYAGAPLVLPGGERVGTLCLVDYRPRTLDATDLAILRSLRRLVVQELVGQGETA